MAESSGQIGAADSWLNKLVVKTAQELLPGQHGPSTQLNGPAGSFRPQLPALSPNPIGMQNNLLQAGMAGVKNVGRALVAPRRPAPPAQPPGLPAAVAREARQTIRQNENVGGAQALAAYPQQLQLQDQWAATRRRELLATRRAHPAATALQAAQVGLSGGTPWGATMTAATSTDPVLSNVANAAVRNVPPPNGYDEELYAEGRRLHNLQELRRSDDPEVEALLRDAGRQDPALSPAPNGRPR